MKKKKRNTYKLFFNIIIFIFVIIWICFFDMISSFITSIQLILNNKFPQEYKYEIIMNHIPELLTIIVFIFGIYLGNKKFDLFNKNSPNKRKILNLILYPFILFYVNYTIITIVVSDYYLEIVLNIIILIIIISIMIYINKKKISIIKHNTHN